MVLEDIEEEVPILKSQRGMLVVIATIIYLGIFGFALLAMATATDVAVTKEIIAFVGTPLALFGVLLTLGFGFFFKDKSTEKMEGLMMTARAQSVEQDIMKANAGGK